MGSAKFAVSFAGPLVTFQDAGRPGHMRYGVAASGPMDRLAFQAAHAALGNAPGLNAIEISLGGLVLQCTEGAVTVAITGGNFVVEHAGYKTGSWTVLTIRKGERLAIRAGKSGSWAYLAFAGDLASDTWLGSHATHAASGFGGGAVQGGQTLQVSDAAVREERAGEIAQADIQQGCAIRLVPGPQDQHFAEGAMSDLLTKPFTVSDAYDRMGMRLRGPELKLERALSIPSEPIVRGSIQVSGDGVPTVLFADHQTTGGYPKIATIISSDIDRLSQLRAGQTIRFAAISARQAVEEGRRYAQRVAQYLAQISVARGTLAQRLMRENLIHGCVYDE